MTDVTQILSAIKQGDPQAASQLLPLVYAELRQLAAHRLAHQPPGQTLQPTALVHEAYLRLVGDPQGRDWDSRGHFFAAAAEAMRRILVERARARRRLKRGGGGQQQELREDLLILDDRLDEVLAVCRLTPLIEALLLECDRLGGLPERSGKTCKSDNATILSKLSRRSREAQPVDAADSLCDMLRRSHEPAAIGRG